MKISKKKETFRIQNNDRKIKKVGGYAVDIRQDIPRELKNLKFFAWQGNGMWQFSEKSTGTSLGYSGERLRESVLDGIRRLRKQPLSRVLAKIKANQMPKVEA